MTGSIGCDLREAFPGGLAVLDPESGALRDVNRRLCELVGRERSDLLGAAMSTLGAEEPPGETTIRERVSRVGDGGRDRFDWRLATAGGDSRPVEVHLARGTIDGEPRVVASLYDIADRRGYERELEQYRRRLDEAMFAGDLAWWEMDVQTGETLFHEHKTDMLGYSPESFETYEDFVALLHPEDYEPSMQAMRDHLEGVAEKYDTEYRIETADGDYRWFHDIGGVTERDADGAPRKVTGIVVDVTRRKETEQRLRRTNEQLALLNRIVRHDIRNDMNLVVGWLDLLRDEVPADHRDRIDSAVEAAEHTVELTHAVRDLLELLDDGEEAAVEPVALRPVVESEIQRIRRSYEHATVTVVDDLPDVAVEANAALSSVVGNLLNNAVRHNDTDRPEIRVDVEDRGETVVVSVADDGPGVPDEQRDEIFSRHERGIESEGSGLGLYLVKTLVAAYGGDVWVEDNEPRGAIFRVELSGAAV